MLAGAALPDSSKKRNVQPTTHPRDEPPNY